MDTLFELPATAKPLPTGIKRSALVSDCGQYRWTLTRTWRAGPHVCFIGVNPSTADHRTDDPTVRRWTHFASAWGYGGFVAVNLYPFRSPNVAACRKWADWENNGPDWYARDRIIDNLDIVAEEAQRAALVVACWGATAWNDMWIDHAVERIQGTEPFPAIHCFGKTAGGAPIHPMARGVHRVPDDAKPVVWKAAKPTKKAAP